MGRRFRAAFRLGEGAPLTIGVTVAFCPWNAGRWRVGWSGTERSTADALFPADRAPWCPEIF